MPPFPERESSILAILKKKKPGRVAEPGGGPADGSVVTKERKSPAVNANREPVAPVNNQSADLLGLSSPSTAPAQTAAPLVDVLADVFNAAQPANNGFGAAFQPIDNLKK